MAYAVSHKSDGWLAITVFGLVLFGVVMIYSASIILGHTLFLDDKFFVKRQIIWAILGCIGSVAMANIDYHFWKRWAGWMLIATLLLLIGTLVFSRGEINGAHRWITIGNLSFQPSELAKLTFIIYLSAWLVERKNKLQDILTTFLPYLGVLLVISTLMLLQPDFGTLSIILVSAISVYYVAGLSWKQIIVGLVLAIIGISLILISPYRRARLSTFLDPTKDEKGASYHVKNIAIAIGSGGVWGLGFGESKQKRLFLPEPHTDSIFAVMTEELGAVRSFLIILVFTFILYRGYRIAQYAPDMYGRLMAVGITTWFAFQAFINLGSMLHLVPLVGVPLPFISFGGTNLVISLAAVGLLLNISRHTIMPQQAAQPKAKQRKPAYGK